MEIWTLSLEGNVATYRQTVGLARALHDGLSEPATIWTIQLKKPANAETLPSNTIVTWPNELSNVDFAYVETIDGKALKAPWPDIIVACRPEVAAVALKIKDFSRGKTKAIQIQDPNDKSGTYNFDRSKFDLIVKQAQESVTGNNVIASLLPLHDLTPETLAKARIDGLKKFPQYETERLTVVMIGGTDEHVSLDKQDFVNLGAEIAALAVNAGDIAVITSRRTAAYVDVLQTALNDSLNVTIDPKGMTYNEALALGTTFLLDGGSGSMGSEIEFTGQPSKYFSYHRKLQLHPQIKVWAQVGITETGFGLPQEIGQANEAPVVARKIIELLNLPGKPKLAGVTPI